jgi:predicted RNase H-like HicB family nuclease
MDMLAEFTAVYELHPNGVYTGYVAEVPEVRTGAKTLEEARTNLAEQLRYHLEGERDRFLAVISSEALIEPLRIAMPFSRKTDAETRSAHSPPQAELPRPTELDVLHTLLEKGLIDEIPPPPPPGGKREEHQPVPIEGKPISEEIIEGRR